MSTATGIYFDGQITRGRTVSIEFADTNVLRIGGEGIAEEIDLALVRVSDRLGDVPRFIYLPGDAVIETPDNAIVDAALGERQQTRGSRLIHALESQQRIAVVACVVLIAAVAAIGFFGPPALARLAAKRVPTDVDQRIGDAALATIRPYFGASSLSAEDRNRVRTQLARLQVDPSVPRPRIEFRSMNGGLPNAFALPGNIIVVTDDLVRLPARDDELAAVLAHELGHLAKRHGLQSLLRNSFAVLIVASVTGDLSALTSFAGTIPLTILTAGYSRDLEREADAYALDLLQARGIKPRAFVTVLVKLEASRESLQRTSTYLSTHPATDERTAMFGGITPAERKVVQAEPWGDRAAQAEKRGDYTDAIADYTAAIDLNPTAGWYMLRAKCHHALNEHALAEDDLTLALDLDPRSVGAYTLRAEILALTEKKYDDAIVAARAALALDSRDAVATATLGFSETMKGAHQTAAADLDRAIALDRDDFRGWAYRGLLKERQGDPAGAVADYDTALKLEPKTQWVHYYRGVLRNRQKDFTGALADFAAVTDSNRQTAEFFFERGRAEHGMAKLDLAIADYGRAFEKGPAKSRVVSLHLARGVAYAMTHNYKSAIIDLDAAIEKDPKNGPAHLERAIARRHLGRAEDAIADLDQAAQAGIGEELIAPERAANDWDLGHYAEAILAFDRIIGKGPNSHAYEMRGLLHFSLGDWEKAEADLTASVSIGKSRPQNYAEFFRLLSRRLRKVNDQRVAFERTISGWPDGWAKWIGWYLLGEIPESGPMAEVTSGGTPSKTERLCEACFYIGMTHLISGDRAAAEDFFQKCLRTGITDFYEYKLARAELARLHDGN